MAAGDHLVHHCPTWQWATGDENRVRPYLPKSKQFLLTRNVPCSRRCKQVLLFSAKRYDLTNYLTYFKLRGKLRKSLIVTCVIEF